MPGPGPCAQDTAGFKGQSHELVEANSVISVVMEGGWGCGSSPQGHQLSRDQKK